MTVVSDASPLISLASIGQIGVLPALYGTIHIPADVFSEVVQQGAGRSGTQAISDSNWIEVVAVSAADCGIVFPAGLGAGEIGAMVLALQRQARLVLMDDRKARHVAKRLGLNVIGCVGVLAQAYQSRLIDDIESVYDNLLRHSCYLDPRIIEAALSALRAKPSPDR